MTFSDNTLNDSKIFLSNSSNAVAKTSVVGYYLRRFIIHFDKLTFSEATGVYEAFQRYYEEWSKNTKFMNTQEVNLDDWEEALASLKESIKISQEANDNVCLQHALSWLYRLTTVNEDKLIIHCILKSSELTLSYTASLGLQTFGQYECLHTGRTYAIFETLTKSDMINCQHNYKDLISNTYSMKSSLWQLYGKTEMSSLWSQLLLYLNIDSSSPSKAFYGEGFCLAVCNIANHLLIQGEYSLVACVLDFAKRRFPNEPNSHIWMLCENLFVFTRSLHHEKWIEAESAAQKITVVDKWEGYLRLAEVYFYKQDYTEADNCINTVLNQYENDNTYKFSDRYYYVRAKILKAEIQFASSYPDSVPAGIITILNNCLIEAQTSQLDYQSALIHLHIANIMLLIGLTGQALRVLDRCLVQILGHGGCFDRARATLLYVKCLVADSHKSAENERKEIILNSAKLLERVKSNFEKVEAYSRMKDVLYLQAQLYHSINMKTERNKCALEYRLLDEEHVSKNVYTLVKYL
ncbi:hypothetical protein NQ314_001922 [Rhamnusium bicolor]|uniref:Anaphase-promoting complex subunit 5 n=1 Tax=Rhamnusium bicolor TaxID=1586634 RepID=A0AAV8ZSW6_9CUCU|nr:hypothetical protein NQ314_001922 [Rhamnusium bicolor]